MERSAVVMERTVPSSMQSHGQVLRSSPVLRKAMVPQAKGF